MTIKVDLLPREDTRSGWQKFSDSIMDLFEDFSANVISLIVRGGCFLTVLLWLMATVWGIKEVWERMM